MGTGAKRLYIRWWLGLDTAGGPLVPIAQTPSLTLWGTVQSHADMKLCVTRQNLLRDILAGFCRKGHLPVRIEVGYGLCRVNINSRL